MTSISLFYARGDDEAFVQRPHADPIKPVFGALLEHVSMPARKLTYHQNPNATTARDRLPNRKDFTTP